MLARVGQCRRRRRALLLAAALVATALLVALELRLLVGRRQPQARDDALPGVAESVAVSRDPPRSDAGHRRSDGGRPDLPVHTAVAAPPLTPPPPPSRLAACVLKHASPKDVDCIDEALFLRVGAELVRLGLARAGFNYVFIDDCWMKRRRSSKSKAIEADSARFPHGIAWLADRLHEMGLKLGIYLNNGARTCQGFAGSEGYLAADIATIASWGADGLKLDGCHMSPETFARVNESYAAASEAIRASGRDMAFICSYPYYERFGGFPRNQMPGGRDPDYRGAHAICDMFRFQDDVDWPPADKRIRKIADDMARHFDDMLAYTGPGHWADADMLLLGSKHTLAYPLSLQKLQLVLWAMAASPLLMSNDPARLTPAMLKLLTDENLLRVHRDPLVQAAHPVGRGKVKVVDAARGAATEQARSGTHQVWVRPLSDGSAVAGFFNYRTDGAAVVFEASLDTAFGQLVRGSGTSNRDRAACAALLAVEEWLVPPAGASGALNRTARTLRLAVMPNDVRLLHVSLQPPPAAPT